MKKKIFSILLLAATVLSCICTSSCVSKNADDDENGDGSKQNNTATAGNESGEQTEDETGGVTVDVEAKADCNDVLNEIYNSYSDFPDMKYYSKPATDEKAEMKANEVPSFFGWDMKFSDDGDILYPDDYEKLEAYAIATPTGALEVQEICVFKFKNGTLEYDMQQICQARITKIKSNYASNANYDTDKSKKAIVDVCAYKIIGRYGIIVCAANPDAAFAVAETAINSAK